ncbi:MAG TPA: indole-3-glycerol phosphate synthase TrpC [Candidatus Eubacterium faecipullorum]|uniref:Indole-3-glycerol phosphate synthase n=1 Tax=Candidatus Eubacterium faecipullorum TaxID=2838571 RepID=A0A9D1REM2_9FIRM|nr:indole-3-glycerol phosphate synthase TrpC [Candidatus Eubacterium faecipullorum]
MTILEQLAEHTKERYEKRIGEKPLSLVKAQALAVQKGTFAFEKALSKNRLAFICEVKKASPSKGLISADFPYLAIARQYEAAGADCISCLTEPKWFLGSDEYLQEIAKTVQIPVLRKDFTVCDYQIYEAKLLGVGAVLLICALLSKQELEEYIDICDALGMSALVEAHDEKEIETAVRAGARVIGVNNRNLRDFSVDTSNAARLRALVPPGVLFVSESGVKTRSDIEKIEKSGANAVLIGETLMKSANIGEKLRELRGC